MSKRIFLALNIIRGELGLVGIKGEQGNTFDHKKVTVTYDTNEQVKREREVLKEISVMSVKKETSDHLA